MRKFNYYILVNIALILNLLVCVNAQTLPYNYENVEFYTIKLSPIETISTKDDVYEGQIIHFVVREDVFVNGKKLLNAGDFVDGRIEMIVNSRRGGLPAEIVIDNFEIPNVKKSQILSEYNKVGRYSWWFRVAKLVVPAPIAVLPIGKIVKGGHAKISSQDVIKIKYYPNWK